MSRISVIIPAYNCELYVTACIDSVLQQTMRDLEVILVDDGSTDLTADICRGYARQDTRFVYLYQKNQGVSAARNHGLRTARSEYVMFVDADDMIDASMCAELLKRMEMGGSKTGKEDVLEGSDPDPFIRKEKAEKDGGSTGVDMVFCGFQRRFYKNGRLKSSKVILPDCPDIGSTRELGNVFGRLYETTLLTSVWGKLYQKKCIDQMPFWFSVDLGLGEDVLFNLEYLKQCHHIATVNQPFYIYNHYGGDISLTRRPSGERLRISGLLLEQVEDFAKHKDIYDQVKERLWKVYYKDCMNYLEQFPFMERLRKADNVFRSEGLCRILAESPFGKMDLLVYRMFLGSGNRLLVCMFAGMRKLAKKVLRGNGA